MKSPSFGFRHVFFAVMEDCWIIEGQTDCKPVWLMRIIYSTSSPEGFEFEGIFQVQKKLSCDSICGIMLVCTKKCPSLRKIKKIRVTVKPLQ